MKSYRFVNHDDFIPHLPFEDMGYYHTSIEYWFQNGTELFRVCNFLGEDPSCSDTLPFWDWSLADHSQYPILYSLTDTLSTCNGTAMNSMKTLAPLEKHRSPDRLKKYALGEPRPL